LALLQAKKQEIKLYQIGIELTYGNTEWVQSVVGVIRLQLISSVSAHCQNDHLINQAFLQSCPVMDEFK